MKGFMFSVDAMLAVGLIAIAATILWTGVAEEAHPKILNLKLENAEAISIYFNETPVQGTYQNQKCSKIYFYDSISSIKNYETTMSQKILCEGN